MDAHTIISAGVSSVAMDGDDVIVSDGVDRTRTEREMEIDGVERMRKGGKMERMSLIGSGGGGCGVVEKEDVVVDKRGDGGDKEGLQMAATAYPGQEWVPGGLEGCCDEVRGLCL